MAPTTPLPLPTPEGKANGLTFVLADAGSRDGLHRANDGFKLHCSINFAPQTHLGVAHDAFWKAASA
jgi:hypothetical protein